MAKGDAQEILQVDEAYLDFIGRYPGYVQTALLDTLRATDYRRLDGTARSVPRLRRCLFLCRVATPEALLTVRTTAECRALCVHAHEPGASEVRPPKSVSK
jgi:hypothetical protein